MLLWLIRQLNDPYVAESKRLGYRSRAAFKLIQLDEKYHFLGKGKKIVDLGCAPGGWTQIAIMHNKGQGKVIGIDILPTDPIDGAEIICQDFTSDDAADKLKEMLNGEADVVMSDMAACIANALLEQEVRVLMTNFATIINGMFTAIDKIDFVNAICGYDLLIIDDLGIESHSEYRMEGLFNVIDRRVRSGKPMIITTNLTMKEMDETQDINEVRIYDRIRSVCQPIQVKGESKRKVGRSKMMARLRVAFGLEQGKDGEV